MDMVADRVWETRERSFVEEQDGENGHADQGDRSSGRRHPRQRRELPDQETLLLEVWAWFASATRPGYDTAPRCPVWAPPSDAAARPPRRQDLANADAILIMGSSMAENHPVGFQWVMEARERGAKIIHVDPRFTRTSAMADIWVPLRAGTDITLPRRPDPLRAGERQVLPRVCAALHQRRHDHQRRLPRYRRSGRPLLRLGRGEEEVRSRIVAVPRAKRKDRVGRSRIRPAIATQAVATAKIAAAKPARCHEYEADPTLQDPRCVFQILKRHFCALHAGADRAACGVPQKLFLKVAEAFCNASGPEKTARHLLRRGMDAALQGRADHPLGGDSADAAGQYRTSRRRHSRPARTRFDSGLDRYSHAV